MKIETFVRKQSYILLGLLLSLGVTYISTQHSEFISYFGVPTPTSIVVPTMSASSSAVLNSLHGGITTTVVSVVDGDTIKIEGGEVVRYIGINTPETVAPKKPIECFGKEASEKNKELVQGKTVELVRDVSNRDRYGRLLRYVWIGDEMINEVLVREGYAQVSTYPPDVAEVERFLNAQRSAVNEKKGIWSGVCPVAYPTKDDVGTPSAFLHQ